MNNLIDSPRHANIVADLRQKLDAWMRDTNDPLLPTGEVPPPPGSQANHHDGLHPMDRVEQF